MSKAKALSKGIYDIVAAYLLIWVLYLAATSLALHTLMTLIIGNLGHDNTNMFWLKHGVANNLHPMTLQLIVYGVAHIIVLVLLRKVITGTISKGEYVFDLVQRAYLAVGAKIPAVQRIIGTAFTIVVTLLLIPFILQPTLVGTKMDGDAWKQRAVNLLNADATLAIGDSVIGFYRKFWAEPVIVPSQKISKKDLNDAFKNDNNHNNDPKTLVPKVGSKLPLLDRWDPLIWKAANNDRTRFAMIKAFMYVESGGRQFAVSHTGCAGLMQFCSGTARRGPFKAIFGRGQVYACGCHKTSCRVSRAVKKDMESGNMSIIKSHADNFPCEITDARFDGGKAIRAGAKYIDILNKSVHGNIYLMYVGYNSGPAIAKKVAAKLSQSDAGIDEIETHLVTALTPYYGGASQRRARSLLNIHLPKIKKAYDRFYAQGASGPVQQDVNTTPKHDTSDPVLPKGKYPKSKEDLLHKRFAP